jgi:hypothetical protein
MFLLTAESFKSGNISNTHGCKTTENGTDVDTRFFTQDDFRELPPESRSWNSVVGIATGYGLDNQGVGV